MRRTIFTLAAAVTALALGSGVGAAQPSSMKGNGQQPLFAGARDDPSFPQAGVIRPPINDGARGSKTVVGDTGAGVNLADTLTMERKATLWWDYARDISAVTHRLLASGSTRSTLLVPVDSAIMRMARKPHQNADGSPASDDQARTNFERFIAAHIIPEAVELPTASPIQTLLGDLRVEIKQEGEGWRVVPGDIAVLSVKEASNGRILYLDQVIDY